MEISDYVEEISGTYARLLLLLDLARPFATQLGESGIRTGLDDMVRECSARLEELSRELMASKVSPAE